MDSIEIYTSKKKSILLVIGSIAFVALGVWLLMEADNLSGWRARNPMVTKGIGLASMLFFGFGMIAGIKRLIKSEIALIIGPKGISVNPKKLPYEFVKWEDILEFEEIKIHSTRILIIGVKNPEHWVEKETHGIRKKLMQFNVNNYGSPFNIGASGLQISAKELKETLQRYFEKYKNNKL
ncbi:STM3941 family protein [Spongiimicrobium sp. 2-473A-2-J]|uniref:STM3941 family protein n=1 Tax=Eudoraea algarum TaxID=3417568 RepID=UPI003D36315C